MEAIFWHGTSTKDIERYLAKGYHPYKSKYDEIRVVWSKYINEELLSDGFLEKNQQVLGYSWGVVSNRFREFADNCTLFCYKELKEPTEKELAGTEFTKKEFTELVKCVENANKTNMFGACQYAKDSAKSGCGEIENCLIHFLNFLPYYISCCKSEIEKEKGHTEEVELYTSMAECLSQVLANVKPEYNNGKKIHIPPKFDAKHYPVVLKFKHNENEYNEKTKRIIGDVNPSDIIGVAFVPDNHRESSLTFLSKNEFLAELSARKKQENLMMISAVNAYARFVDDYTNGR